ncbi:hypothetical protein BDV93DRAFT_590102 [Ceratobasidium sp. AG-I]|nr:hypothetical protein BDV93DRAFT_590102 [Ceratobasidium sp. AG-I]
MDEKYAGRMSYHIVATRMRELRNAVAWTHPVRDSCRGRNDQWLIRGLCICLLLRLPPSPSPACSPRFIDYFVELKLTMNVEWRGHPALILGVDIGTTYSGVTFLHLTEGAKPSQKVQRVTEWSGQKGKTEAKVPTLVCWTQAVKIGAEAYKFTRPKAKAAGLKLAEHFKHHLHPSAMVAEHKLNPPPALPYDVPLEEVYTDFMTYLLENTKSFFERKVLGGKTLWAKLYPTMQVILAHPNGWGTPEQGFLRQAARRAGMASSDSLITFVTEAEASVHFCLSQPKVDIASSIEIGDKIIVCDAGGSTVDTTLYKITKKTPLQLEEVKSSACVQAGGIFVDQNARLFLEGRFKLLENLPEVQQLRYIDTGVDDFIKNAKNQFNSKEVEVTVKVGSLKDDFGEIEVDSGEMMIASPYLFARLNGKFDTTLATLNDKTAKAVADGCVIWLMEQSVVSRTARLSYGTDVTPPFHPLLPHHMERRKFMGANGILFVAGGWSEIVEQGTSFWPGEVKRETYCSQFSTNYPSIMNFRTQIYSTSSASRFDFSMDDEGSLNPGFSKVCELSANLMSMRGALESQQGLYGVCWRLKFVIGIRFGGTELEAFIEWEEDGKTRTGPVSIIAAERQ